MLCHYILKGHEVVEEADVCMWGKWFESADRSVNRTIREGVRVSTVFLGINHNFDGGAPLVFETMVFGGELDGEEARYATWDEAEAGHKRMCEKVFKQEGGKPW